MTALRIIDMQKGMPSLTLPSPEQPAGGSQHRPPAGGVAGTRSIRRPHPPHQPFAHVRLCARSVRRRVPGAFLPLAHAHVVVADACFTFDKVDFGGMLRRVGDVHLMALANLHGEYAEVRTSDDVLRALSN